MQMPPTDAMRDKSESEPRKEGLEEGRQRPSTPPRSFYPASQSSIITNLHTNSPAKHTLGSVHKGAQKRKTYAGCVRRSD